MKQFKTTKETLLKGSGANQHVLHGKFLIEEKPSDFAKIIVSEPCVLKHEQPDGSFAEHKPLPVIDGNWAMGKQIEYNPFNQTISRVWD